MSTYSFFSIRRFIEENRRYREIAEDERDGLVQVEHMLSLLLNFAQRNRGMTRVLIGDALVNENERLQARINLLHDKLEAAIKQALRVAATQEQLAADADFGAGRGGPDGRREALGG